MIGPVPSGVVRAVSPLTRWVFRASPDRVGATDISVESLYIILFAQHDDDPLIVIMK